MNKLALVGVAILLSVGCMVDRKESETRVSVGNDRDTSAPIADPLPGECENFFEEMPELTYIYNNDIIIAKKYRVAKGYGGSRCVVLTIGFYQGYQRSMVYYSRYSLPTEFDLNDTYDWQYGSLAATLRFMKSKGISCEERAGKLVLTFPVGNLGHEDYNEIELNCADSDMLSVHIGLDKQDGKKLAITTTSYKPKDKIPSIFNTFDTDDAGVIERHVKVWGKDGKKTEFLSDYKKIQK